MAEPTVRFQMAGAKIQSQVENIDGQILFFVDIYLTPERAITVGWNVDHSKFGIYENGDLVYPTRESTPEGAPTP